MAESHPRRRTGGAVSGCHSIGTAATSARWLGRTMMKSRSETSISGRTVPQSTHRYPAAFRTSAPPQRRQKRGVRRDCFGPTIRVLKYYGAGMSSARLRPVSLSAVSSAHPAANDLKCSP